jgi:GTP-binding protein
MNHFRQTSFIKSAPGLAACPDDGLPWLALAGRSNVGKSSVINNITERKKLARTACTPGKTAFLNFYRVDGLFYFVDLPGYGFASVSKTEKQRWAGMMEEFYQKAEALKATLLIVDARHPPTADDRQMAEYMTDRGLPYGVIANKWDKLKPSQRDEAKQRLAEFAAGRPLVLHSAEDGTGREDARDMIAKLMTLRNTSEES